MRDDQIESYKLKLDGASPEEAKAKIENLEKELEEVKKKIEPRRLSADQLDKLASIISEYKAHISVARDMSYGGGVTIATQIADAFHKCGWQVSNHMVMGIPNPPLEGIAITISENSGDAGRAVIKAFKEIGMPFSLRDGVLKKSPHTDTNDIEILITSPID